MLSICVAQKNPHIKCLSVDLSPVTPIALETVEKCGLSDQVEAKSLDMIHEDFPSADVITMGNILHDWDLERKKFLIKKAYEALPPNGALIVIENIIDDERKENVFGLLMSLNMLIETEGGFDYSYAQFELWAREAGFKSAKKVGLNGPCSAIIAYK
jgi:cyclopropane fatty-acyl-phospholipid synthase-like methyltransferase